MPTRTAWSTLAEFMAQADRNFARCDLNKDGRIDTAECRQALQRPRANADPWPVFSSPVIRGRPGGGKPRRDHAETDLK